MRIAVFCGSSGAIAPELLASGRAFGALLAARGLGLVYGGAKIGLMGAVADAVLEGGGEVIGVLPHLLADREVGHPGLTRLELVDGLHPRKARMAALADAFAILPGGLGTLDEAFEILTWRMLGLHEKPIACLDVDGFWQPLALLLGHLERSGFVRPTHRSHLHFCPTPEALLAALAPH